MLRATSDMERETAMRGLEDEAPGCGMLSEAGFASRRMELPHEASLSRRNPSFRLFVYWFRFFHMGDAGTFSQRRKDSSWILVSSKPTRLRASNVVLNFSLRISSFSLPGARNASAPVL
jgi:hypothetical protein